MAEPNDKGLLFGRNSSAADLEQFQVDDPDRRSSIRFLTILRVGRISSERDAGLCRVQNISDEGMMLTTGLRLNVGERVLVALSDAVSLAGSAIWQVGERAGVRFAQPIDAGALLQFLAGEHKAGNQRAPRLPTNTIAVAETQHGTIALRVVNISQQGMGVFHDGSLEVNEQIKITLENGLERRAVVRWSHQQMAGLLLLDPISFRDLGSAREL